ncbi:hypothetical protein I4J11_02600 [Corynebacterium diphtheriae bv. mitis]|nr:hypothetical protein [Corynebacterium diphtheriae]MBG9245657.1 hypothetical protein [Corynebacterium diphtheriae bv. mitis]
MTRRTTQRTRTPRHWQRSPTKATGWSSNNEEEARGLEIVGECRNWS